MNVGFVLISVKPSHIRKVFNEIYKIPDVLDVNTLFGEYDIIAKIEAESTEELGKIVIDKIRSIEGISDTRTLRGVKLGNSL
jgi:DNA-binding Lrp family transcriptional regulator